MDITIYYTTDGYRFFHLADGRVVDNLDDDCIDMSWPSLEEFKKDCEDVST